MKRTHLPLNALRVYDAAARHLPSPAPRTSWRSRRRRSGSRSARSRTISGPCCSPHQQGAEPTQEGAAGLDALREGFLVRESVPPCRQASDSYTIARPREFYAQWLAPRLARFGEANPDIRFTFVADENADFTEPIRLRDPAGRWPGRFAGDRTGRGAARDRGAARSAGRAPDQWIDWGLPLQDGITAHVSVSNAGQALSSALAGLGKAILPELLVKDAIDDGRLEVSMAAYGHAGLLAGGADAPMAYEKVKSLVSFLSEQLGRQ